MVFCGVIRWLRPASSQSIYRFWSYKNILLGFLISEVLLDFLKIRLGVVGSWYPPPLLQQHFLCLRLMVTWSTPQSFLYVIIHFPYALWETSPLGAEEPSEGSLSLHLFWPQNHSHTCCKCTVSTLICCLYIKSCVDCLCLLFDPPYKCTSYGVYWILDVASSPSPLYCEPVYGSWRRRTQ